MEMIINVLCLFEIRSFAKTEKECMNFCDIQHGNQTDFYEDTSRTGRSQHSKEI